MYRLSMEDTPVMPLPEVKCSWLCRFWRAGPYHSGGRWQQKVTRDAHARHGVRFPCPVQRFYRSSVSIEVPLLGAALYTRGGVKGGRGLRGAIAPRAMEGKF